MNAFKYVCVASSFFYSGCDINNDSFVLDNKVGNEPNAVSFTETIEPISIELQRFIELIDHDDCDLTVKSWFSTNDKIYLVARKHYGYCSRYARYTNIR